MLQISPRRLAEILAIRLIQIKFLNPSDQGSLNSLCSNIDNLCDQYKNQSYWPLIYQTYLALHDEDKISKNFNIITANVTQIYNFYNTPFLLTPIEFLVIGLIFLDFTQALTWKLETNQHIDNLFDLIKTATDIYKTSGLKLLQGIAGNNILKDNENEILRSLAAADRLVMYYGEIPKGCSEPLNSFLYETYKSVTKILSNSLNNIIEKTGANIMGCMHPKIRI